MKNLSYEDENLKKYDFPWTFLLELFLAKTKTLRRNLSKKPHCYKIVLGWSSSWLFSGGLYPFMIILLMKQITTMTIYFTKYIYVVKLFCCMHNPFRQFFLLTKEKKLSWPGWRNDKSFDTIAYLHMSFYFHFRWFLLAALLVPYHLTVAPPDFSKIPQTFCLIVLQKEVSYLFWPKCYIDVEGFH